MNSHKGTRAVRAWTQKLIFAVSQQNPSASMTNTGRYRCGHATGAVRNWLHYLIEYEYLTASGRIFTGVVSSKTAAALTVKNAIAAFESMDWYFRGGSAFGGKLLKTTGSLKPWLTPFPGK